MDDYKPSEIKWITAEMFSQGWYENRNEIIYHHDWTLFDVIRRDREGNYLVRLPKPEGKA